jgi:hypothetical protein
MPEDKLEKNSKNTENNFILNTNTYITVDISIILLRLVSKKLSPEKFNIFFIKNPFR